MSSEIYVALSGQMAMETRLATIANNVANMRTAGYRAESVTFETVLSSTRRQAVAFAAPGATHTERAPGPIEPTGNPLDVAIVGDGWFALETPGGPAYTRDGRFTVTEAGDLVTLTGYGVLDEGGAPIAVDVNAGPLAIGVDGRITQNGAEVAVLGLVTLPAAATLTRVGDSAFRSDVPGEPAADRVIHGVRQGYLEGSNVNPILAITELIGVQRAFEQANTAISGRQETLQAAVRTLGAD